MACHPKGCFEMKPTNHQLEILEELAHENAFGGEVVIQPWKGGRGYIPYAFARGTRVSARTLSALVRNGWVRQQWHYAEPGEPRRRYDWVISDEGRSVLPAAPSEEDEASTA